MNARTLSILATGTLLGTLVIAQGQAAQDPPAPQEATAEQDPASSPDATEATAEAMPHVPTPPLDLRRIKPLQGDAVAGKAKAEVCGACHGAEGIAIAPLFPNLAGQHAEYLYWQLQEYKRGNVPPGTMTPLVTDLSDTDMRDIAMYYASLPHNPPTPPAAPAEPSSTEEGATDETPATPIDPALVAQGESLYLDGNPAKGMPPCQGCHGGDAMGFPDALKPDRDGHVPYAVFPILRGQQHDYLQTRLAQYQAGTIVDSSTDKVMNSVGHRLDSDSIAAISAYLSGLDK